MATLAATSVRIEATFIASDADDDATDRRRMSPAPSWIAALEMALPGPAGPGPAGLTGPTSRLYYNHIVSIRASVNARLGLWHVYA
jgi:hypothetical protein